MDDAQIGELWEKNYPRRSSDPTARQVCRLICHLIDTMVSSDAGPAAPRAKLQKVLAPMNIAEAEYESVKQGR